MDSMFCAYQTVLNYTKAGQQAAASPICFLGQEEAGFFPIARITCICSMLKEEVSEDCKVAELGNPLNSITCHNSMAAYPKVKELQIRT